MKKYQTDRELLAECADAGSRPLWASNLRAAKYSGIISDSDASRIALCALAIRADERDHVSEALLGLLELVLAIQENNPALFIPSLNYNQRVMAAKDALCVER